MGSSLSSTDIGRRGRQKLERERRILTAARRLFDRKGYAGTAMEDVAERAGLAVGTVYNYFSSKDALLLAIVRRETDQLTRIGERILDDPPADPIEAVAALADLFVQSITADERRLWRELFAAAIASPQELGARVFELDTQLIVQLAALIDRFKQYGAIAYEVDAGLDAMSISGICG